MRSSRSSSSRPSASLVVARLLSLACAFGGSALLWRIDWRLIGARAGLELRIAVTLDPARFDDRFRLARLLLDLGGEVEAIAELESIAGDPAAGATRAIEARGAVARIVHGARSRATRPPGDRPGEPRRGP